MTWGLRVGVAAALKTRASVPDTSSMDTRRTGPFRGLKPVHLVILLAVGLVISGVAVPVVSRTSDDSQRQQAEADARMLAAALEAFRRDTGSFPTRNRQGEGDRLYALMTGARQPVNNPFSSWHYFERWARDSEHGDVLDHHLIDNAPGGRDGAAYPTRGERAWRGPYLERKAPLDPWGRPYVINVISAWYRHSSAYKRVFVLSAGPNGRIDTSYYSGAEYEIAGDDVGVIVHTRT